MFINRVELAAYYLQIIQLVATKVGIENVEWKGVAELTPEIGSQNPSVFQALTEFVEAYNEWYDLHERIEQSGKAKDTDHHLLEELVGLIAKRNKTRKALIHQLNV